MKSAKLSAKLVACFYVLLHSEFNYFLLCSPLSLSPFLCIFPLLLYNPFYQYWSLWRFPNPLISILFTPKCSCFKFKLLETNDCSDGSTRNGWMTKTPLPIPPPSHKGKKRKEKKRKPCQTHHQLKAS